MKKFLALLLAAMMTLSFAACGDQGGTTPSNTGDNPSSDASTPTPTSADTKNEIIRGSVTDLDANMMAGWTNSAANNEVRNLIFGYSTIFYTKDGQFVFDPVVVKSHEDVVNEDGTKTYTIGINEGLTYNDGTAITAKDFVFTILLYNSKAFEAQDGSDVMTMALNYVGHEAYNSGESKVFSGVRLLDDYTFSVTIKAEELPFHFDVTYASVNPMPIHVIAPECEVKDDGQGAYMSDNFTADLLTKTISDSATGYRYLPKVTCGPYQLESHDQATKQAVLTLNPKFAGLYDGRKPTIEKLILKSVTSATAIDELKAGTIDLFAGVSGGTEINSGLTAVEESNGGLTYSTYLRAGYGQITFSCDFGPTQFVEVRQAIAYLLDRDEFARQYSGGFAKVVDGKYGLSLWEYQENKDKLEAELNHYTKNPETAKQRLIDGGWTLNKDGNDFVEGTDDLRYKKMDDGSLMPLEIKWANSPNNPVSDLLNTMLPKEMEKIGMKLSPTTMEFGVLLNNIYRDGIEKPEYHMFNLATGFVPISSYWYESSMEEKFMGNYNQNFLRDEQLAKLGYELKAIPSDDREGWSAKWLEYQKRWNELMPNIPLYSDEYHDFYDSKLKGYEPDGLWDFASAILYSDIG